MLLPYLRHQNIFTKPVIQSLRTEQIVILANSVPLCLLLDEPVKTAEEVTITHTNDISNFILVCTNNYHIFRFVCTLRSVHLTMSELKPIVIMCFRPPTQKEFSYFSAFPQVYFFVGNPTKSSHLEQAGILRADKIVLTNLSANSLGEQDSSDDSDYQNEALSDSPSM